MSEIVVDRVTRDRLLAGGETVLVRDESGAIIGRFQRDDVGGTDVLGAGVDFAELQRRAASDEPTYTTAEVLAYVKGRTP
jgi:hypothetical protein